MRRNLLNRIGLLAIIALAAIGGGWISVRPVRAVERVTDEEIRKLFGKQHTLMEGERRSLESLLGAFLNGDRDAINHFSDKIVKDMSKISTRYPPDNRQQAAEWQAMADIITQAGLMHSKVEAGLFDEAYDHFAVMTKRCVACHQVRRTWGLFKEPGDTLTADEATQTEQKTTNFLRKKVKTPTPESAQSDNTQPAP